MGKGLDQLSELRDGTVDYLKLRWASLRLEAVEKISGGISKAFGYLLAIILIVFALAFLTTALALWLGELLGPLSLGFLIGGGVFVIGALVMFILGRKLLDNTMVRYFIGLFFTDKEHGYGTRDQ